jgi:CBS domain-containing protein
MLVKERMKDAVCVTPDQTLAVAARILKRENIGCLPVCQADTVLGMITDRDIAMRGVADGFDSNVMKVSDVMSLNIIRCGEDDTVESAVLTMHAAHVQRLAVTNGDGHLVGVISMSDVEGGASERRPYEVVFYKEVLGNAGMPYHSELMRVAVAQGTKQEAVEAAIAQFEKAQQVSNWATVANGYDVVTMSVDADGRHLEDLECTSERDTHIRPRAQTLWEDAGAPEGRDVQFWEQAANEVDANRRPANDAH